VGEDQVVVLVQLSSGPPAEDDGPPAGIEAHMMLFNLVSDEFEASEEGDTLWLDAALHVLASDLDQCGRSELRDVLEDIALSPILTADERRRLKAALVAAPPRHSLWDLRLSADGLRDHILTVLDVCDAYVDAIRTRCTAGLSRGRWPFVDASLVPREAPQGAVGGSGGDVRLE
jgi:hypothetical protein